MPGNAIFDAINRIDTSYSFRIIRSEVKDALSLGRGAAIHSNSDFDLGPDARVNIGAFTMIDIAQIVL